MMRVHKKPFLRMTGSIVIGVVLGFLLVDKVVAYKIQQILHPERYRNYSVTLESGEPVQAVSFESVDGLTLAGWYIPPQNGAVIILQHGYRANSAQILPIGLMLARHGYGVLLFDFRGHGKSEGDTVTFGLYEVQDTDAAVKFVAEQTNVQQIGLLGNSMGGAVGVLATAENPQIRALAIEGVFSALKDEVGVGIQVQTPLPASPLDSLFIFFAERQTGYKLSEIAPLDRIHEISPRPILIMQGGKDERIHPNSGYQLFETAGEPKILWYEPSSPHVEIFNTVPLEYEKRVVEFFDHYLLNKISQ